MDVNPSLHAVLWIVLLAAIGGASCSISAIRNSSSLTLVSRFLASYVSGNYIGPELDDSDDDGSDSGDEEKEEQEVCADTLLGMKP